MVFCFFVGCGFGGVAFTMCAECSVFGCVFGGLLIVVFSLAAGFRRCFYWAD